MEVLCKLLLFSLFMLLAPALVYIAGNEGYLDGFAERAIGVHVLEEQRNLLAGALAIVTVNLVIGSYVFMAFREGDAAAVKRE